jgi:hypothetical protein
MPTRRPGRCLGERRAGLTNVRPYGNGAGTAFALWCMSSNLAQESANSSRIHRDRSWSVVMSLPRQLAHPARRRRGRSPQRARRGHG